MRVARTRSSGGGAVPAGSPRERGAEQGSPTPSPAEHLPNPGGANQASSTDPTLFVPWAGPAPRTAQQREPPSRPGNSTVGTEEEQGQPGGPHPMGGRGFTQGPRDTEGGGAMGRPRPGGDESPHRDPARGSCGPRGKCRPLHRDSGDGLGSGEGVSPCSGLLVPEGTGPLLPLPRPPRRGPDPGPAPPGAAPGRSLPRATAPLVGQVSPQLPRSSRSADPSPTRPSPTTP